MDIEKINENSIRRFYGAHRPKPIGTHRFFSVLVPFVEKDGRMFILLEERAKDMITDPGEICFPGGQLEEGESPLECALRETYEETGIAPEYIDVIGRGDTLYGFANYTLYTTIAVLRPGALDHIKIQKSEVAEVFLRPLDSFSEEPYEFASAVSPDYDGFPYDKAGIREDYKWRTGRWSVPIYESKDHVVWGLTALMIRNIIRQLKGAEE